MRLFLVLAPLLLTAAPFAAADVPSLPLPGGATLSVGGNLAYDVNRFSRDARHADADGMRRAELGLLLDADALYATAVHDVESQAWLDVFARLDTAALGRDVGRIRVGQFKVPFGLEGSASTRTASFMEQALPTQAFFPGRRLGLEWTHAGPAYRFQAGLFGGEDLAGGNPGSMAALRGLWVPWQASGRVLHLGMSLALERPRGETSADGEALAPMARLRARPDAGLTDVRLLDSGVLDAARDVHRSGLEFLWIHGSLSLQGEALQARITRGDGRPDYRAEGQYLFASWLPGGESRAYRNGHAANVVPTRRWGAVELLARYDRADLDDGPIGGGRGHAWTLGANWYLGRHIKLQLNHVAARAHRQGGAAGPCTTRP